MTVWLVIKMYSSADKTEGEPLGIFYSETLAREYASEWKTLHPKSSSPLKVWPFDVEGERDNDVDKTTNHSMVQSSDSECADASPGRRRPG